MIDELPAEAMPWNTGPSGEGKAYCDWCGRNVYGPAVPCSVRPIKGIETIPTLPGFGERCKWEARTRASASPSIDAAGVSA